MYSSAVVSCAAKITFISAFTRSTVSGSPSRSSSSPLDLRAPEQVAARVHRRLGRTLRAAHARELRLGLRAAAVVEELLVDVELDAVGAQAVGEPDGEVLRDARPLQAEARHGSHGELGADLSRIEPRRDQLVDAELLGDVHVEQPELAEPRRLHRVREDVPAPSSSA